MNEGRVGRTGTRGSPGSSRRRKTYGSSPCITTSCRFPAPDASGNIVFDAGDLLHTLVGLDVDIILSGHKHVPSGA